MQIFSALLKNLRTVECSDRVDIMPAAVANAINADPSAFDSDVIDTMQQMSDLLNQYQQMLSGDDEYTQEDLDKMTEWFGQVQDWVDQVKADLNIE